MQKYPQLFLVAGAAGLLLALALVSPHLAVQGAVPAECVGKPYGWPGCPTKPSEEVPATCGNSFIDSGEECDDGARFNGQTACGTDCKVQKCGDGKLWLAADEECEPPADEYYSQDAKGNMIIERRYKDPPMCGTYCLAPRCDETGPCLAGCKWVFRDSCSATAPTMSSLSGSSIPASSETSSASASVSSVIGSAPSSSAVATSSVPANESGSSVASSALSSVAAVCGDGVMQGAEECDDGNEDNFDACTASCKLPRCGDGFRQGTEECDDGNADETDICTSKCTFPVCGNGVVEGSEVCDDGNGDNTDTCTSTCRTSRCGDGAIQLGEECDDGKLNSDTTPDACRTTCRRAACGDNVIDQGEQCDGTPVCEPTCKLRAGILKPTSEIDVGGPHLGGGQIAVIAGSTAAAGISISGILFRKKLLALLGKKVIAPKTIEDIPLDQIEMPWHKW